jgi:hypothetical protein
LGVHLSGGRQLLGVGETASIGEHRQLVAAKGLSGENVDLDEGIAAIGQPGWG